MFFKKKLKKNKNNKYNINQGADSRIVVRIEIMQAGKTVKKAHFIDASSKQSGDYKNIITVNRASRYVTDKGLQLIELYKASGKGGKVTVTIELDSTPMYDWLNGIREEGIGNL